MSEQKLYRGLVRVAHQHPETRQHLLPILQRYRQKQAQGRTTVTPAYGRDYRSKAQAIAAWEAGEDFILQDMMSPWDGKPIDIESAREAGYHTINIRYRKLRSVAVYKM
jgi:hypothetical protein